MIISLYISLCWLLLASAMSVKKIPNQEFAFVFLIVNFINTNLSYVFGDTLHLFGIAKEAHRYVSFSLLQSIMIPLFIAIMINLLYLVRTFSKKILVHLFAIGFLIGTEALSYFTNIVSYSEKHVWIWLIGYKLLLFFLAFAMLRSFRWVCSRS